MQLSVFTGLPGVGKSSTAEAVARALGIPVFAKDWLEATLIRCELKPAEGGPPLGSAGYQLLTTLAERQLRFGQSVGSAPAWHSWLAGVGLVGCRARQSVLCPVG